MNPEALRWRQAFLDWAQTQEHKQVVAQAHRLVQDALHQCRQPYLAYSGGKDSTAMLHLVLQHKPDIMVLHWDYGRAFVPQPVHEEILRIAEAVGATNLRVETSPLYERLGRRARNVLGKHMIGRLIPRLAREGYDLCFVGLRKEESLRRRRRILAGRQVGIIQECWAIADWRWLDVWAYLHSHNLPYLSLYDERASLMGYDHVRFTTLFDPEFTDVGAESIDNILHWRWRHQSR